jgi:tryptophan-rich sensory protein
VTGARLTTDDMPGGAVVPLLIVLCTAAAAGLGGIASVSAGEFYAQLERPDWAPPAWLFAPVWTALYVAMAVAAWLVWRARARRGARRALGLYALQLGANALWPWTFFAWKRGALAFAEILVLLALVLATVGAFRRVRRSAALLLVPYLLWVAFATALTWSVWRANPGRL